MLGAFLAGLDGGLIYNTWPDMNGNFFPNDTDILSFFTTDALMTPSILQFIHRIVAYVSLVFIIYITLFIFTKKKLPLLPLLILDLTIIFQICLGILTLLSGVKIAYASLHQIGSIFLISSFLYIYYRNIKINLLPSS